MNDPNLADTVHQVTTALSVISSSVQYVLHKLGQEAPMREEIAAVRWEAERAADLLHTLEGRLRAAPSGPRPKSSESRTRTMARPKVIPPRGLRDIRTSPGRVPGKD